MIDDNNNAVLNEANKLCTYLNMIVNGNVYSNDAKVVLIGLLNRIIENDVRVRYTIMNTLPPISEERQDNNHNNRPTLG